MVVLVRCWVGGSQAVAGRGHYRSDTSRTTKARGHFKSYHAALLFLLPRQNTPSNEYECSAYRPSARCTGRCGVGIMRWWGRVVGRPCCCWTFARQDVPGWWGASTRRCVGLVPLAPNHTRCCFVRTHTRVCNPMQHTYLECTARMTCDIYHDLDIAMQLCPNN